MLSFIGVEFNGLTFDAGGNNARFIRYLFDKDNFINSGWIQRCSFTNVYHDNLTQVYVWLCSTHNFKSI